MQAAYANAPAVAASFTSLPNDGRRRYSPVPFP